MPRLKRSDRYSQPQQKNKFESQQIHKHFKNRHRGKRDTRTIDLECRETNIASIFDTTDMDRVLRECRGRSTSEIIGMSHEYDLVRDDGFDFEWDCSPIVTDGPEEIDGNSAEDFSVLDFEWACERCTYINWPDALQCAMCDELSWKVACGDLSSIPHNGEPNAEPNAEPSFSSDSDSDVSESEYPEYLVQPLLPVSFVIIDFLTPIRKRASKAQRQQEQIEKEKEAAKRRFKSNRPDKDFKYHKQYPKTIVDMLPTPNALAGMTTFRNACVELLCVPARLQRSVRKVVAASGPKPKGLAFHGTNETNTDSIMTNGLLVGGTETERLHGAACGQGVYCGKTISIATGYSSGNSRPIFVCLVLDEVNIFGEIYVVPRSTNILPVYLLTDGPRHHSDHIVPIKRLVNTLTVVNARPRGPVAAISDSMRNESSYESVMLLCGPFGGRINQCDVTRRARRMWSCG